jgi:hypothetical protein
VGLVRRLAAIEEAAGVPAPAARSAALAILADRDAALSALPEVEPPAMSVAAFQGHLAAVVRELQALPGGSDRRPPDGAGKCTPATAGEFPRIETRLMQ